MAESLEDAPTVAGITVDRKLRRIYLLVGVAWLFHAVGDPVVTYLAVDVFAVAVESNPFLRGTLGRGPVAFAIAHVPLFVGGVVVCGLLTVLFESADGEERERLYWMCVGALSVVILWGIGLVVWNLLVLVQGV